MAENYWERLPQKRQHAMLLRLATLWFKRRKQYGCSAVGPGWRTFTSDANVRKHIKRSVHLRKSKGPHRWHWHRTPSGHKRILTDEACLRFLVNRKDEIARDISPIPAFVVSFTKYRGKRRRCLVPTDVDQTLKGTPHTDSFVWATFRNAQNGVEYECGWPCCVVAADSNPDRHFALGCNHAFTISGRNGWNPRFAGVQLHDGGLDGSVIGVPHDATDLAPSSGEPGFDAALVSLTGPGRLPAAFRSISIRRCLASTVMPRHATLFTPRGSLRVSITGYHVAIDLDYADPQGAVSTFTLGPVVEYIADPITQKGDSGSPLIDQANGDTLCGMHFYGFQSGIGLAHPAIALFAPQRFSTGRLSLVPQ